MIRHVIAALSGARPLLLLAVVVAWPAAAPAGPRPNVVLIVLDDMNDWVGALDGHPQARTPRIDRLASAGTLFTNAHAAAPLCHPSRVSVMTGISPGRSGIRTNKDRPWRDFLPQARSLNQLFHDAGYYTAGYGKIYHGSTTYQDPAYWDEYLPKPPSAEPPARAIPINGLDDITRGGPGGGDWGIVDAPKTAFEDHIVATEAARFIRRRDPGDPQPFFVALGLRSTHSPWYFPVETFNRIAGGDTRRIKLPASISHDLDDVGSIARNMAAEETWQDFLADEAAVRWAVHAYLAAGKFADVQVGRVLDALDAAGVADNTIVALISDNGYHLGEKQTWQKNKLWEEDSHVPMVFRLPPGLLPAVARRVDEPVSIAAVFPTLLELADVPGPDYAPDDPLYRVDYRSLVALMDASVTANWAGPAVTFGRETDLTLRQADARLTLYRDGYTEYYDRLADPDEWFNQTGVTRNAGRVRLLSSDARRYSSGEHAPFGFRETCGAPDYAARSETGVFVWQDCGSAGRTWHLRVTGGRNKSRTYRGELSSDAGFTSVTPAGVDKDDVVTAGLEFSFVVRPGESAGLDVRFPVDASSCLGFRRLPSGAAVHFGATRFPVSGPVDLHTLEECAGPN